MGMAALRSNGWPTEVPSNPYHSVWFCDSVIELSVDESLKSGKLSQLTFQYKPLNI